MPDLDEMVAVARQLGMELDSAEATVYHRHLQRALQELNRFVSSNLDEGAPPVSFPERDAGWRPGEDEDPLNAWMWKCHIQGSREGLLAGKTVSYKDHVAVAGIPMTIGSLALEGVIPNIDATIVTRVLAAGGTIVGKNTMDGIGGALGFGHPGDYGRVLNPHRVDHLSGGSSSGCAVAVVARDVDIAFGGDQGGSIRIPSAWSGAVGLKPTFGLVSHFGAGYGSEPSIDHVGPIARSVEDVALALQATAGYDSLDPRQNRSVPVELDATSELSKGVEGLKIGILEQGFAEPIDGEVRETVLTALEVLEKAGAELRNVSIDEHRSGSAPGLYAEGSTAVYENGFFGAFSRTYYPPTLTAALHRLYRYELNRVNALTKLQFLIAEFSRQRYHGAVYAKSHNVRPAAIRAYDRALAEVDVLAMPTCVITAPRYEPAPTALEALERRLNATQDVVSRAARNTSPFNYSGHPALAVPCGKARGLPVSLQLVGRYYEEQLLLRVAFAYSKSVAWDEIVRIDPVDQEAPKALQLRRDS